MNMMTKEDELQGTTMPISINRITYGWNLLLTNYKNNLQLIFKRTVIKVAKDALRTRRKNDKELSGNGAMYKINQICNEICKHLCL